MLLKALRLRGPAVTRVVAAGFAWGCATAPPATPAREAPAPMLSEADASHELTADQQVRQVLDRLAFGPRPGDVRRVRTTGVGQWIELQLHPERIDDHVADSAVALFPTMTMRTAELAEVYALPQELRSERQAATARGRPASGRGYVALPDSSAMAQTVADSLALHGADVAYNRIGQDLRAVLTRRQL